MKILKRFFLNTIEYHVGTRNLLLIFGSWLLHRVCRSYRVGELIEDMPLILLVYPYELSEYWVLKTCGLLFLLKSEWTKILKWFFLNYLGNLLRFLGSLLRGTATIVIIVSHLCFCHIQRLCAASSHCTREEIHIQTLLC